MLLSIRHLAGLAWKPNKQPSNRGQIQNLYNNLACTTVFVWEPYKGVGHASIYVLDPGTGDRRYVSSFPDDENKRMNPFRTQVYWQRFSDDCDAECHQDGYRKPEHIIQLPNLNHTAMMRKARARVNVSRDYRFLRRNCSTVVASILRAGLSYRQAALLYAMSHKVVWTPTELLAFAWLAKKVS